MSGPALQVTHRINSERLVLLGWSRAILLQLAHPLIAAAVSDHSTFRGGATAAATRLHNTVRAMLHLTFGDPETRARGIAAIRAIHDRVHGALPESVGPFPEGTRYSAHDPALLLWVHATLIHSVILAYETFVRPATPAERDAYCDDAATIAIALGTTAADIPRTWSALGTYLESVEQSGHLIVSRQARDVADAVLSPPMKALIWPAIRLNRQFTVSTLPRTIRRQYGFEWTPRDEDRLQRAARIIRGARALTPATIAAWNSRVRRVSAPK